MESFKLPSNWRDAPVEVPVNQDQPLRYWPFDLVKALPYSVWRLDKEPRQLVAGRFFDKEKFWTEQWNLHFFWARDINPKTMLILISEHQVLQFISKVQGAFPNLPLLVPREQDWPGLVADFGPLRGILPYELGVPESAEQFKEYKDQVKIDSSSFSKAYSAGLIRVLKKTIVDTALCLDRKKTLAKQAARATRTNSAAAALIQIQQYLGLRSPTDNDMKNVSILPTNRPVPWSYYPSPVLVSIDVEAYERNQSIITEIGVATFDIATIASTAPGHLATDWQQQIRGRHFRILEYHNLVNTKFVQGCPENFRFGKSEMVRCAEIPNLLASCFRFEYGLQPTGDSVTNRPVVLIGHNTQSDVKYLRKIGFNVTDVPSLISMQDTAQIYGFLSGNIDQTASLAKVLEEVKIDAWHLHNAGNDAWYTLAACLGLAVAHRQGMEIGAQDKKWGSENTQVQLEDELLVEI
ncbi:hypothetical protein ANO11243_063850 [Dothideomycetidae sp. 11243]|nr:hypothetical protein ANO11243_063850 [fungal sp. No.11243]